MLSYKCSNKEYHKEITTKFLGAFGLLRRRNITVFSVITTGVFRGISMRVGSRLIPAGCTGARRGTVA